MNIFAKLMAYWGEHYTGEKREEPSNWSKAMEAMGQSEVEQRKRVLEEKAKSDEKISRETAGRDKQKIAEEKPEEIKKAA